MVGRGEDRGRVGSLLPPRAVRRFLLPCLLGLQVLVAGLFVVLGVLGLLTAPFDRRVRLLRLGAAGLAYLALEWTALLGLAAVWIVRPWRSAEWYDTANRRLVGWVLGQLQRAAGSCVGFSVVVEDPPVPEPLTALRPTGPVLVLARHGGLGDSFTLVWILLRHGRRPRVVLKEILAWEPLIDVALGRMGVCFLPPHAGDAAERIAEMASSLANDDAMLLFPEGGNWTPRRRLQAIVRLRSRHLHRAARAARLMEHVLPARPAGVLACLDARPDTQVVVVAHAGLDRLATAGAVWRAIPFATPMTVRWWPSAPAPTNPGARQAWLTTEWAVVDEWIDERAGRRGRPPRDAEAVSEPVPTSATEG